jgi:hypothetical protein
MNVPHPSPSSSLPSIPRLGSRIRFLLRVVALLAAGMFVMLAAEGFLILATFRFAALMPGLHRIVAFAMEMALGVPLLLLAAWAVLRFAVALIPKS